MVTPSLHHATTAAVLRSGWQAHSDRKAFAVDIQSARVRRAQAMIEGVRAGQTVGALLGYQFERALHDAKLDRLDRRLPQRLPAGAAGRTGRSGQRRGAGRDRRAQRRRRAGAAARPRNGSTATLRSPPSPLPASLNGDAPAVRRMFGELDETFDAVGDLLLAESVHQLVGGSALRAGLAADAVGPRDRTCPPTTTCCARRAAASASATTSASCSGIRCRPVGPTTGRSSSSSRPRGLAATPARSGVEVGAGLDPAGARSIC